MENRYLTPWPDKDIRVRIRGSWLLFLGEVVRQSNKACDQQTDQEDEKDIPPGEGHHQILLGRH
jgi:hypothetical protein